jgi:hypothetical protein
VTVRHETHHETPDIITEALLAAANGNADPHAHIGTIRALIEQGCDLQADVLPVVARLLPQTSDETPGCSICRAQSGA